MGKKVWTKKSSVPNRVKRARSQKCLVTYNRPAQMKANPKKTTPLPPGTDLQPSIKEKVMANQEPTHPLPSVYTNVNRKGAELPQDAEQSQASTLPSARRPMLPPLNTPTSISSVESILANRNRRGAELPEDD